MSNEKTTGMPSPQMSDTRADDFWKNVDYNLYRDTPEPKDLSVGLGDAVKAVGAGALDLVGGIGEAARQASVFGKKNAGGNTDLSYADQASARMANRLSPVLDTVAALGGKAQESSAALVDSMSDDAKEAMHRSIVTENDKGALALGDGAGDIDVWAMKFANGLGSMLPTMMAGGITGIAAKQTLGRAVTASMVKRGASQEVAEAVAAKAVEKIAAGSAGATAITGSVGSAGLNAKETVNSMTFDELKDSSSFREAFLRIDGDQQYQGLSDLDKLSMARDEVANLASAATMGDVKTWGAAAAGSLMGDVMLFKMLNGKGAKGIVASATKGAAGEGVGEMLEEGTQQYAVNQAVSEITGIESDPWKGVASSAIEGGLIGAGTGGAMGAAGGTRTALADRKAKAAEDKQNQAGAPEQNDAATQEQDPLQTAADAADHSPVGGDPLAQVDGVQPDVADVVAEQLDPLAKVVPESSQSNNAAPETGDSLTGTSGFDEFADVPAFLRNSPDRDKFASTDAQAQAFRDKFDPEREQGEARGTLDKRELRQPTDNSEMGVSGGQFDEFRDVPASRIRGVPDENTATQQVLSKKEAAESPEGWHPNVTKALAGEYGSEVRDMIAAQIKAGDQGATQAEQAARKPFDNKVDRELNQVAVYKPIEGEVIPADTDKPSATQGALPPGDLKADYTEIIPESHRIGKSDVIYANGEVSPDAEGNSAYVPPVLARNQPDTSMDTQSTRDPRSDVAKAIDRAGEATDSVFGPLKTMRITRRGKPFASQKEAQMASRKGIETPVELNGGGYGVAEIAEIEQAKVAKPEQAAEAQEATPAVKAEDNKTQTTPAADAGVSVSGGSNAQDGALLPWSSVTKNPDGTATLIGDPVTLKSWAKENGIRTITRKDGVMVAKSAVPKLDEFAKPAVMKGIEAARTEVNVEPTEAQKEAGNYKKGHVKLQGLDITLENPKGSVRSGTDADGKAWQSTMAHDYGYIKRTEGADGDHVDAFIGDNPESQNVYVVDQRNADGTFDEHKVMLGFDDEASARAGYLANYSKGWKGLGDIRSMTMDEFKGWLTIGDTTKPATQAKIGDFGDKLGGARKDVWSGYQDKLEGNSTDQIAKLPLSRSWPAPDYQGLIDAGMDIRSVALMRAMREAVPTKPRTAYRVSSWATSVKSMRDLSVLLMNGELTPSQIEMAAARSSLRHSNQIGTKADLYEAVGHKVNLSDIELSQGHYSLHNGVHYDPPKAIWQISKQSNATAFSTWPRVLASGDSKAEVLSSFKSSYQSLLDNSRDKSRETSFDIYSSDRRKTWVIGKKIGRNYVDLAGPFDNVKDARGYRDAHQDELEEKLKKTKEIPRERRDINQPRVGEDMRGGMDVTPELFTEAFGFRGVEFGNWVEQARRQKDLNDAYDALMDMAAVIGVSPKALSLNGELGLAFGARGSGGVGSAAAHYEPGKIVINLTKKNGAGSLGHEWWHAMDNYFARMREDDGYMSEARDVERSSRQGKYIHVGEVRREMIDAFGAVKRSIDQTSIQARSAKLDSKRSKEYWGTLREMSARAFESYLIAKLQDQHASNDYLANIVSNEAWDAESALGIQLDESYPYPTAGEIPGVRAAFDHFFDTIQEKEVDGKRVLYSRNDSDASGSKEKATAKPSAKGMTKKEVELIAKGFVRQYKGAANILVTVVQTQEEANKLTFGGLPEGYKVHAFYQGDGIGRVVLVADNLTSAKHALQKMRHEVLVHHGFQAVIGDVEYGRILRVLWDARDNKSLKPLWDHVQDVERDTPLEGQLEELLAYVAEKPRGAVGRFVDRIVGMVAQALRKVGFISKVTEAELRNIVEAIGDRMKAVSIYADKETDAEENRKNKNSNVLKGSMVKFSREGVSALEGSDSKGIRDLFADGFSSAINLMKQKRPLVLGALSDLQIDQVYRDITGGAISRYQKLRTQMEADRNDILLDAETRIDPLWDALSKDQKSILSNVMYDATMYKLHPDISLNDNTLYQEAKDRLEKARKPETRAKYAEELKVISDNHKALSERYKMMPAKSRELYKTMKGVYDQQWNDLRDAIDARLTDLMGDKSRELSERMRTEMERALQHGPYFPLTRFGDYVVKATRGDEYIREHFESRKDAERAVKQYQRDGYNARLTVKEDGSGGGANANKLGAEIMEMLDKASKEDGASLNISELKDDVWQSMLKMLPDASYAKHAIHRRRVKGASRDAHRAYLNSVYHYARHLSKIKYGHKMAAELEKFNEQIQAGARGEESVIAQDNLEIAQQVLNEMNKRHELNMNPQGKSWAGNAGTLGFLYYIGPSVASAVINMTQNFTVMFPQLGAKYGFANASSALTNAMSDYIRHGKFKSGTTEAWQSLTRATTGVSADEKALLNTLYKAGVLDLTQAHSIAAKADTDQQDIKPSGKLVRTGMRWAGALFHNAEVLNREVAALAAYRLLKKAEPTLSPDQYADKVAEMVYDGHGNYAASNRPRYMRSDIVKVLSQFKIYSQMMTYVVYSNAIKAAKGDKVALKTLGGVLGAHWVMAGVMGLPYPITAAVYALSAAFDDDDDRSGEASFRLGMTEALGKTGADLMATGPMNLVTNLSIAGRTGINDLWWREPNKDVSGDDLSWHYVQQILGPVAGIGINLVRGTGKVASGDVQRGVEMALPVSIRNVSKAYRQATEGEQTNKGDIILDDIPAWNIAMQAIGFGNAQMADIYEARGYIKGKEERIGKQRSKLLTRYYLAKKDGDSEEVETVLNDIRAFNTTHHPTERITGKSLALSLKSKARSDAQTQQGVYLKKSREYLRSEGEFARTGE